MIDEESEKIAVCHICLETLTTNLYFASDGYLYDQNCFGKINFKVQYLDKIFLIIYL